MNTIFWFRRDLRLKDNVGLHYALKENENVLPIFIFDKEIITELAHDDKRINFIYNELQVIKRQLNAIGSDLIIYHDYPENVFKNLFKESYISNVYTNHDYEPYSQIRDKKIKSICNKNQIEFKTYKDQVIFEKDEILKENGTPYLVFTPYSKIWKKKLEISMPSNHSINKYKSNFKKVKEKQQLIRLSDIGFDEVEIISLSKDMNESIIKDYEKTRDFPGVMGTTNMSVHFRFGTVSIREQVSKAKELNEKFLNELIWREYFMSILYHFPETATENFHKKYDKLKWRNNQEEFDLWCAGRTGFPLVDAGMRELNETGLMHNRVRMVVANFLTKLLLIDWRWGEEYFAKKLLDYEMSSNVGNWQWAAGTGVDAAPYFRIFRPELQVKKYDKDLKYIKKWIPEYSDDYIEPIVDYQSARKRALETYKNIM